MPPAKKGGTPPTPPPTTKPTRTGGGGDGGGGGSQVAAAAPEKADEDRFVLKRRVDLFAGKLTESQVPDDYEFSLNPGSLVGSWFHRLDNDAIVWQGCVVGIAGDLPMEGPVYLCQIDKLDVGAENVQRLIPLSRLVNDEDGYDWRFYDSEDQARAAYAAWVATERDRA
jgi:hypothetical protein